MRRPRGSRAGVVTSMVTAAAVAVAAGALHAPVRAGDGEGREQSTRPLLDQQTLTVPDRSRAIPALDAVAGCGDVAGGRYAVDGDPADWTGQPTGINGTGRHDAGEYIWTDYPFDDAGTGELRYPGEREAGTARDGGVDRVSARNARYGGNAADIVELRLAADASYVYGLVRLNFLNAVDSTVVGLGLDVDLDPGTGFADWPLGARLRTDGLDAFVTLHGTCGVVTTTAGGDHPLDALGGAVRVDTAHNVMEVALPRTVLGGAQVRVVAGAGLWNPSAGGWLQPVAGGGQTNGTDNVTGAHTAEDPAVFNLLFRGDEPLSDPNNVLSTGSGAPTSRRAFQVARQIEVLSGGTTGGYAVTLDLDRLLPGAAPDPVPARRGDEVAFTRQYRSRLDLEGLLFVGNQLVYLSRYQPYAVYLPACFEAGCATWPAGRAPLAMNFHGGDGSHVNQVEAEAGVRVSVGLSEAVGAVTAAPLGRGRRQPWWRGPGELDVLEIIEDVERVYGTDPDRRLATGASLGGYATVRLASLYPDLWAGAAPHCPATYENSASSRAPGGEVAESQTFTIEPVVPGMLNVPFRQTSGTGDPLVRIASGHRLRDAALGADLDVWYTEYPNSSHCFLVPAVQGGWMDNHVPEMADLLRRGRVTDPRRVRYVIDARHYPAGPEVIGVHDLRDLGVRYEGAYWVSGLVVRPEVEEEATRLGRLVAGNSLGGPGPEVAASIDAASHGRGAGTLATESCGDSVGFAGLQGGNPSALPDEGGSTGVMWNNPNHWICQAQLWSGGAAGVLDLAVRNLAAATVDLRGAGLQAPNVVVRAAGDGPFALTLVAPGRLTASGPCVVSQSSTPGALTAHLDLSSPCEVTISRGR
jgi:hypothetical protein